LSWLSAAFDRNKKHAKAITSVVSAIPVVGGIASSALDMAFDSSGKKKGSDKPQVISAPSKYRHKEGFGFKA
jgi:hypothetical protein